MLAVLWGQTAARHCQIPSRILHLGMDAGGGGSLDLAELRDLLKTKGPSFAQNFVLKNMASRELGFDEARAKDWLNFGVEVALQSVANTDLALSILQQALRMSPLFSSTFHACDKALRDVTALTPERSEIWLEDLLLPAFQGHGNRFPSSVNSVELSRYVWQSFREPRSARAFFRSGDLLLSRTAIEGQKRSAIHLLKCMAKGANRMEPFWAVDGEQGSPEYVDFVHEWADDLSASSSSLMGLDLWFVDEALRESGEAAELRWPSEAKRWKKIRRLSLIAFCEECRLEKTAAILNESVAWTSKAQILPMYSQLREQLTLESLSPPLLRRLFMLTLLLEQNPDPIQVAFSKQVPGRDILDF